MNVNKKELLRDIEKAPEFDQSALFKKIYEEEYGVFGGAPFGALVGDFEFGKHPEDMALAGRVSHIAAQAHAPFVSAASPDLMNLESYQQLDAPRDLGKDLRQHGVRQVEVVPPERGLPLRGSDSAAHAWPASLRGGHQANRRVCLRRARGRHGSHQVPVDECRLRAGHEDDPILLALWHVRCHARRGRRRPGGRAADAQLRHRRRRCGDEMPHRSADYDRREKELADLGFVPLVHCKGTDYAAFFSVQSCQKPKVYDTDSANANARLSTQLPYIMAVSRFAHYLKAMMRDKIGSFMSREEASTFLNRWITKYVTPDDSASPATKAERPLREARIDVTEVPGKPGCYRAVAFLRPHFQLDELTVSLRLVAELPAAAK